MQLRVLTLIQSLFQWNTSAMKNRFFITLLLFAFACSASLGAGLEIAPVHINFKNNKNIDLVRLTNATKHKIILQLSVKRWLQKSNDQDVYKNTQNVLVTPPLVSIPAGETQNVRVAYLGSKPIDKEKTYRLLMQQVRSKVDKVSGVKMSLSISLPIFVQPVNKEKPQLAWNAHCKDGKLDLGAKNIGNMHAQITNLALYKNKKIAEKNVFTYLLPGSSYEWHLKLPSRCVDGYALKATVNQAEKRQTVSYHG